MRRTSSSFITLALLLVFGLRALIPAGYMPAADGSGLQLCPQGLPPATVARLLALQAGPAPSPAPDHAHHDPQGAHDHANHAHGEPLPETAPDTPDPHGGHAAFPDERCSFAAGAVMGPATALAALVDAAPSAVATFPVLPAPPATAHRHRPQQPRAPPSAS
jgi:hypothetical protein